MCSEITNQQLTAIERKWVSLFLEVDFFWRDVLIQQVNAASIGREYHPGHWYVDFDVPHELRTFPKFKEHVPIQIMVHHIEPTTCLGEIYCQHDSSMPVFLKEGGWAPTCFLLHVYGGAIQELEIFDIGLDAIPISETYVGRCDYWISPDFAGM